MLCPHLHERMKRARCNKQTEALLKEARDIAVGLTLPAQFADQVSTGFQLGAWRFGRKVGKPGKNDLRVNICGGRKRKRMHRYPAGRPNRRLTTMSRSLGGSLGTSLGDPKIVPIKSPIPGFQPFPGVSQGFHSCPVVRYLPKSQVAHNPKVAGSNPAPATKESTTYGNPLLQTDSQYMTFGEIKMSCI